VQNDHGWRSLVSDVLGLPELTDDPRFATNVDRVTHRADCDRLIAEQTARWFSADLAERLFRAGVPAARINEIEAVVDHPQLQARDRWRTVATEYADVRALLPPVDFLGTEAPMGDVPALGQHTRALLTEAGLPESQVAELMSSGVAHQVASHG
jgi:itaconate CoA-transferase